MPGELIPIIIVPSLFLTIGWVVYVVSEAFRRRQQSRIAAEFHAKLLDRIGSVRELGEFLNTAGGGRFLDSLTLERETGPHTRILRAVQTGLVLLSLGIGLFMIGWWNPGLPDEGHNVVNVFGTIAVSLGIGLLLSAGASYGLSRRLGLINGESHHRDIAATHSA